MRRRLVLSQPEFSGFVETIMEILFDKLLGDFERGLLSRRQLAVHLAALAGATAAAAKAEAAPSLKAITLNHVTVKVPDLHKTSNFYQKFFGMKLAQQSATIHILSVGDSFFGIEQKPGGPALDHYDFGLQGWNAKAMRAKVAAAGLTLTPGARGDDESFKFNDPDGFVVQVNGPKYTGHVGP
ncbi:MAG TPA: VOC family protein [Rhizomicrobium sp.]|nr:VOC family protein [Rhizomicrobium sp.]